MASRDARLRTYRQKRDFARTPEPAPGASRPRRKGEAHFVVHRHEASRLHHDVRLEIEGVLVSWAVPKEPLPDPRLKRLAVRTEDHPLAYLTFEGHIPEGSYGAGDSRIWDTGTYSVDAPESAAQGLARGRLTVTFHGKRLKGAWHLIRTRPGKKEQWLLFKARDAYARAAPEAEAAPPSRRRTRVAAPRPPAAARRATAPAPRVRTGPEGLLAQVWPPMQAVLSTPEAATSRTHRFEVKYDGYRALAAVVGGKVALHSRNQKSFASRFPEVVQALAGLKAGEVVLDGELVALDEKGRSRFRLLAEEEEAPRQYVLFDVLWLEGEDVRGLPLEERRALLERVLSGVRPPLVLAGEVKGSTRAALQRVRKEGLEGLLAKRRGSTYQGRRSEDWLKLKVVEGQEVTIVGYTPILTGAPQVGALLVAVRTPAGGFRYAGKVGTGFTRASREHLFRLLAKETVKKPPVEDAEAVKAATWVRPHHVAQVAFTEWTADGRMRHPSFQGLREDKRPEETRQELPKAQRTETVPLTHPERVLYPDCGLTKGDVVAYYDAVAPVLVPALAQRPLSFQAWPRGIDAPGYFRQGVQKVPPFVPTARVRHQDHPVTHVVVDTPEALRWLANQSALTLHMPSSRLATLEAPDWMVLDLDPPDANWEGLAQVARVLRELLERLSLTSVPKTSGKKGLHVLVPLAPGHTHVQAQRFAEALAAKVAARLPALATVERALEKRKGRLYLDAQTNGRLKTVVAPYSLRAVPGAPVSTPLLWKEVTARLDPSRFTLRTLPRRLDKVGDVFRAALGGGQRLPAVEVVEGV